MEKVDPWPQATRCAGRIALGASLFPLASVAAYAVRHSYGAAMAVLLPGGIVMAVAILSTIVAMVAGRQTAGLGWLGGSIASLFAQAALLVILAVAWRSTQSGSRWRPRRGLRSRMEAPLRPRDLSRPR